MKLSILVPALNSRPWQLIVDKLMDQASNFCETCVEVLCYPDNGELTSGQKRNELTKQAQGEYIAFVDDDDDVTPNYADALMVSINAHKPDVVAFNLEFTRDDRRKKKEIWSFGLWSNNRRHGRMSINHLCAWNRELAMKVAWCNALGYADDRLWFEPLVASGIVKYVHRINEILYHYQYSETATSNQRAETIDRSKEYIGGGLNCFQNVSNHSEIYIEIGGMYRTTYNTGKLSKMVLVRDCNNHERFIAVSPYGDYRHFHTITN